MFGNKESAAYINIMYQIKAFCLCLLGRAQRYSRSIINNAINTTKPGNCLLYSFFYLFLVPYITLHRERISTGSFYFISGTVYGASKPWVFLYRFGYNYNISI